MENAGDLSKTGIPVPEVESELMATCQTPSLWSEEWSRGQCYLLLCSSRSWTSSWRIWHLKNAASLFAVPLLVPPDIVRTCVTTKQPVAKHNSIITHFTNSSCLNLNTQKLEVLQVGPKPNTSQSLEVTWYLSQNLSQCGGNTIYLHPVLFPKTFLKQGRPNTSPEKPSD